MWSLVTLAALAGFQGPAGETAFVDVTLVPLAAERTVAHQTVLVSDGTIAAIGPVATVPVPPAEGGS